MWIEAIRKGFRCSFVHFRKVWGGVVRNRLFNFKLNNSIVHVLVIFFVALFLLYCFFGLKGAVSKDHFHRLSKMTVEVKHEDGTVDIYKSNLFNYTGKKDKLTIHLPLEENLKAEYQSINFFFYSSVVKAYYKDQLLASYGENVDRHMIGHLRIFIPVPIEAYGDEIRIEIQPTMNFMEDNFHLPVLMSMNDALFFPILGVETSFAFFYMVLIGSYIGLIILACLYFTQDYAKEGFWLMLLINGIVSWYMGNSGMIYASASNENFNAVVEYIGMYMLFFSAPLYASYETSRPIVKKYLTYSGRFLCGVFVLCLVLYLLPTGYSFVTYLRLAQGIQIIMVFSSLISLLFPGKQAKKRGDYIMQYGMIFVAVFGLLEQIRIMFASRITERCHPVLQWFTSTPFARFLIYSLLITFLTSYAFKVAYILEKTLEEKHLKILAYTDNLTSIGNRQYLQRKLDLLDNSHSTDYAVIFADINDLKYTNDHFGHGAGDRLIKIVASAIKDAVDSVGGFTGRNGGDEFLSVISPAGKVNGVAEKIRENLACVKESEHVPFPVSLSLGIASYKEVEAELKLAGEDYITTSHVIRKADARMYEDKCIHKRSSNRWA